MRAGRRDRGRCDLVALRLPGWLLRRTTSAPRRDGCGGRSRSGDNSTTRRSRSTHRRLLHRIRNLTVHRLDGAHAPTGAAQRHLAGREILCVVGLDVASRRAQGAAGREGARTGGRLGVGRRLARAWSLMRHCWSSFRFSSILAAAQSASGVPPDGITQGYIGPVENARRGEGSLRFHGNRPTAAHRITLRAAPGVRCCRVRPGRSAPGWSARAERAAHDRRP